MIKTQLKIVKKQETARKIIAHKEHEILRTELKAIKLRTFVENHQKAANKRVAEEKRIRAKEVKKEKKLRKHHKALLKAAIRRARQPDPTERVWTH